MNKTCTKCKVEKSLDEFSNQKHRKDGKNSWCKDCCSEYSRESYYRNHEKNLEYFRNRYHNNKDEVTRINNKSKHKRKDKINWYFRERSKNKRDEFLELYGEKCTCCGETEKEFLALDHVNGQRGRKRERGAHVYHKAIKAFPSTEYRILCHNCNFATRYGKPCPHQVKNV